MSGEGGGGFPIYFPLSYLPRKQAFHIRIFSLIGTGPDETL
jgi:hypothetical protein